MQNIFQEKGIMCSNIFVLYFCFERVKCDAYHVNNSLLFLFFNGMYPSTCFACYTERVEYPKRRTGGGHDRLSYTRVIGIVRISNAGAPYSEKHEPFIPRNIFTSPVRRCTRRPGIIEIQRWSGKYTLAPRARGNKWLTLATSGRRRGKKEWSLNI